MSAQIVGVAAKIGMLVGAAPTTHAPTWDSLLTKVATGTINLVVGVAIHRCLLERAAMVRSNHSMRVMWFTRTAVTIS